MATNNGNNHGTLTAVLVFLAFALVMGAVFGISFLDWLDFWEAREQW